MSNAKHLSKTAEHYTPGVFAEAARGTMGGIDLDPATCGQANRIIRAPITYGPEWGTDGLQEEWGGRVFLNPPGGSLMPILNDQHDRKTGELIRKADSPELVSWKEWARREFKTKSLAVAFWVKLTRELGSRRVEEAVFLGFTLEILVTTQGIRDVWPLAKCPICIPSKRIKFLDQDLSPQKAPTHANVIAYCGASTNRFVDCFEDLGVVRL